MKAFLNLCATLEGKGQAIVYHIKPEEVDYLFARNGRIIIRHTDGTETVAYEIELAGIVEIDSLLKEEKPAF